MRRLVGTTLAVSLLAGGAFLWTPDRDRASLEARWLASPADRVELAGSRLHVRDEGPRDAPALLLVHGFGSSLHTWDAWAAGLRERWRVVRLDLPGHGLSDPDPHGDYTDARSHALLEALLESLGLERATLIGHSIGGRIAWSFAATARRCCSGCARPCSRTPGRGCARSGRPPCCCGASTTR